MESELIESFVQVKLKTEEDFLKIAESLTRIGVASNAAKKLTQTCHILHKKGKYYIVHFKEMLALDGNDTTYTEEDCARRNKIAAMLEQWGLLTVVDKTLIAEQAEISKIKVIPFADKKNWELVQKYSIGTKR